MIGPTPTLQHEQPPSSLLKRKLPSPSPPTPEVEDVCSYETICELLGEGEDVRVEGSPASLESGYQTETSPQEQDYSDEDSNLSWLLNFKVSSLFDPAQDRHQPPAKEAPTTACMCAGPVHQRGQSGKPPFTYTELIEKALKEQGELTVSGIYTWISTKYPYYNPTDDRWKNSVRHNLSINPHFRKGTKSRHGAGHLWTLSNEGVNPPPDSWKRCRTTPSLPIMRDPSSASPMMDEDEAAIAAANIPPPEDSPPPPPMSHHQTPESGLHRVAEEILSGVKRRVEVQYLVHDRITNETMVSSEQFDHAIILFVPGQAPLSTSSHPIQSSKSKQCYQSQTDQPEQNGQPQQNYQLEKSYVPENCNKSEKCQSEQSYLPEQCYQPEKCQDEQCYQSLNYQDEQCYQPEKCSQLQNSKQNEQFYLPGQFYQSENSYQPEQSSHSAQCDQPPQYYQDNQLQQCKDPAKICFSEQSYMFEQCCQLEQPANYQSCQSSNQPPGFQYHQVPPACPFSEFLNPVSKEELVSESGLDTSHCETTSELLSELNGELHLPDNLFSDELAFTCYSQL